MENTFSKELQLLAFLYGGDLNKDDERENLVKLYQAQKNSHAKEFDLKKSSLNYLSVGKAPKVKEPYFPNIGIIFTHKVKGQKKLEFKQFFFCQQ